MYKIITITILSLLITGCGIFDDINQHNSLSKEEIDDLTNRARIFVLENKTDLDSELKDIIRDEDPKIKYYVISGKSYVDYSVTWIIPGKIQLILHGIGDIHKSESFKEIRINKLEIRM